MSKKAAIILSGCGFLDGSEIHESVLLLLALARNNINYHCFSLNKQIITVKDHITKSIINGETRNMLSESARIARGEIKDISHLNPNEFDMLCLPGGFGVATNLSNFATKGNNFEVDPLIKKAIRAFHEQKKPIIAICLAPILVAKSLDDYSVHLTLGPNDKDAELLKSLNMKPKKCNADQICIDEEHRIYSAPGYMVPPDLKGIFSSLEKIVVALA